MDAQDFNPKDEFKDLSLLTGQGIKQPEMSDELQKDIGEALLRMFDKNFAIATGEFSELERKSLQALYVRSKMPYFKNMKDNIFTAYIYDYVTRTMAKDRKRAKEITEILKEAVGQYNRRSFFGKLRNKATGERF
jgi:hypothetical protein